MVRFHPRSLESSRQTPFCRPLFGLVTVQRSLPTTLRFVSVPVARVLGKNEDRVQFSNEPLTKHMGSWSNGKTSLWHGDNPSSILGDST